MGDPFVRCSPCLAAAVLMQLFVACTARVGTTRHLSSQPTAAAFRDALTKQVDAAKAALADAVANARQKTLVTTPAASQKPSAGVPASPPVPTHAHGTHPLAYGGAASPPVADAGNDTFNITDGDGDGRHINNAASNASKYTASNASNNAARNASNTTRNASNNAASNGVRNTAPTGSVNSAAVAEDEQRPAGDDDDGDPDGEHNYGKDNYRGDNYQGTDAWAAPEKPPYYAQLYPEPMSEYQLLPQPGMIVAVHLVHVPGTDKFVYMERPNRWHPHRSREIAGTFDVRSRKWTRLSSPDSLFCAGHALMSNGNVAIVGRHVKNAGYPHGIQSIRTISDGDGGLTFSTFMRYPPLLTPHSSSLSTPTTCSACDKTASPSSSS
eukprot:357308-Chlamydomonas_euryale.AAC.4